MGAVDLIWDEGLDRTFVVKALLGGEVVGRASGRWTGEGCCEMESVEVLEGWRRRGIGRALVGEVQARSQHVKACSTCEAGAHLLARCGFVAGAEPDAPWSWLAELPGGEDRDF